MLVLVICGSLILSVTGHGGHQHSAYLPEISENNAKSFLHYRHIRSLDINASPHPDYCTYLHPGYEYWCERHIPYCQGQQEFTREHRCATLSTPCSPGQHCVLTTPCPAHFRHACIDINECDSNPCQNGGTCHNGNNQYTCTCLPGWTGTNCEIECTREWYGVNCSQQCVGHCRNSTTCNHVTGHCDDGCDVGFKGPKCDKECDNGTYGNDCVSSCSGHCLNDTPCNKKTGHCDKGCKPGYTNDDCSKECLPGHFGVDCKESCSGHCINDESCNHISGHCSNGCQDGYIGEMCNNSCKEKYYGKVCSFICSQNCKTCRHTDGFCTCFAGYTGFRCNEACYQSYGENCQFRCSQHCRNKNCSIINGTCLYGCTEGFYGEKCDKDISDKHDASSSTWMIGFSISFAINVILIILVLACLWGIYTKKLSFPRITTESVYCESTVTKTDEASNYQELKIKEDMAYQNSKENNAYEDLTLQ